MEANPNACEIDVRDNIETLAEDLKAKQTGDEQLDYFF